jgi:hypothetical protein
MTCGPITTDPIVGFLKQYKGWKKTKAVHFVSGLSHPDLLAEIEKAKALGAEKGLAVTFSAEKKPDVLNVIVVTKPEDVRKDEFCLHMPFLPKEEAKKPAAYVPIVELANRGGLWVGVNNTRNAVQSALRLAG